MERRFTDQLTQLGSQLQATGHSKTEVARATLQCCLETLQIQRAGLWLFSDDDLMTCYMLLDKAQGVTQEALMIDRWSFPAYFAALDTKNVIRAVDAFNDPATAELRDSFLRPMNIRSLLDVPIKQNGKVYGIICCEQTETLKHWSLEEVAFVVEVCRLYSGMLR